MTPEELRMHLAQKLEMDRGALQRADQYYNGKQPLRFIDPEMRQQLGSRMVEVVINWPRLVCDSLEERLDVVGFRLSRDLPTDENLWRIWQSNNLDEASQQAHIDALVYGRSFISVGVGADGVSPMVAIESPLQVTVERDPGTGMVIGALKRYRDADGYTVGVLMTATEVRTYRSQTATDIYGAAAPASNWQLVDTQPNVLGRVPVVPLVNRPRTGAPDGISELADLMPLADAVNKVASDMLVTAEYAAMPRRWITGLAPSMASVGHEQAVDLADAVRTAFESSRASKLWIAPSPETKFGQFEEAQLSGFVAAIDIFVKQLAAIAALPPHYVGLSAESNPASAEAIRSAEASLVTRARRRQRIWGGAWEEVMRLAVHVQQGTPAVGMADLETVWANPETRTVAQAADAAVKLYAAGVIDRRAALEDIGYTPAQIERMTGSQVVA